MAHSRLKSARPLVTSAAFIILVMAVIFVTARIGAPRNPRPAIQSSTQHDRFPSLDSAPFQFKDVTRESGVDFAYHNGEEAGYRTILESLGGGVAVFDFDSDGWPDLFFPGGGEFPKSAAGFTVRGRPNRLYRNLGNWRFRDVTAEIGLDGTTYYGHGAAVGDYDNDGDPDLLVTSYQGTALYRNEGGRQFVDVTNDAGLAQPGWSTSAAWADFDRDGRLDLFVTRYVSWSPQNNPPCRYRYSGEIDICAPSVFTGLTDALYHNERDGKFREVGRSAGLLEEGKGLGVVAGDFDGDRDIDIYVANDTSGNFLYRNRGDGTFDEVGFSAGVATSAEGVFTGSMGVFAADYDGDGDLDLWVSNYEGETNELYRNEGAMSFTPMAMSLGLGAISRPMVGWGTGLFDLDNDGKLDVFVANGHLMHHLPQVSLAQRPLLFRQLADGRFEDVRSGSGAYFAVPQMGRGCAGGDLDNDGDLDLVIVHQNQPVVLLRNESNSSRRALVLRLEGRASNRSAIGAVVVVKAAGRRLTRSVNGGGSYLSHNDSRLLFGLDNETIAESVEVAWPGGATDRHENLATAKPWFLREGQAPMVDASAGTP
jgi:enediyne biosynthesis protein E4